MHQDRKIIQSQASGGRGYFEAFPEETARSDVIMADAAAKRVRLHLMPYFLAEEADRFLPRVFTFGRDDIFACRAADTAAAAELAIEGVVTDIRRMEDCHIEHLYLANPVWDRPFIRLVVKAVILAESSNFSVIWFRDV